MTQSERTTNLEISNVELDDFLQTGLKLLNPWESPAGKRLYAAADQIDTQESTFFHYYYMGYQSYGQIARKLNLEVAEVSSLHTRTVAQISRLINQSEERTKDALDLAKRSVIS